MANEGKPSRVPSTFVTIYDELQTEITWMHARWLTYRDLFAETPKRIELLNECAPTFFYFIQNVLLDEIQIALSKLSDPARTGPARTGKKYDNLSLEQLQSHLELHGDPNLASVCRRTLNTIHDQCRVFRTRRHKQLAHWDLATALKLTQPISGVSRQMIEQALLSVRNYMNAIESHYNNSEWRYEDPILNDGSEALLSVLRAGLRYQELLDEGVLPYDDWCKGRWSNA